MSNNMSNKQKIIGVDTPIRVLVFRDAETSEAGYEWSAVALECDVWGFGSTAEEASHDLEELMATHVEFATGRKEYDILDHPADEEWFRLWEELERSKTNKMASPPQRPSGRQVADVEKANLKAHKPVDRPASWQLVPAA